LLEVEMIWSELTCQQFLLFGHTTLWQLRVGQGQRTPEMQKTTKGILNSFHSCLSIIGLFSVSYDFWGCWDSKSEMRWRPWCFWFGPASFRQCCKSAQFFHLPIIPWKWFQWRCRVSFLGEAEWHMAISKMLLCHWKLCRLQTSYNDFALICPSFYQTIL